MKVERRYDPGQPRAADGRWGAGPGSFDLAGLTDVVEAEGTFGELAVGVDDVGDVRVAFHEDGKVRELDLGADEAAELGDAVGDLASTRDDLPDDADAKTVYDDAAFGFDGSNRVELYGNGVIAVTFGYDDEDPYVLLLDPPDDDTDDVAALTDALDEVLQGGSVNRASIARKFDPAQPRLPGGADGGQWSATGALRDTLKLDGRISLGPAEHLVGSGRVDSSRGGIRMAVTETVGRRMVRFGAGGEAYGQRDTDNGIAAWDGNPPRAALPASERDRLTAEQDALDDEWDTATPDRRHEIEARQDELRELLNDSNEWFNGTANLDEYSVRRVVDRIRPALEEAIEQHRTEQNAWAEIERLEEAGDYDDDRMAELRRIARVDGLDYITFTEGIVTGSEWGDVHFTVEMGDDEPYVLLGVMPKNAPDNWGEDQDWQGVFTLADMRKFFRLVDRAFQDTQRSRSPENGDAPPAGGQFATGGGRVGGKGKGKGGRPPRRRGTARPAAPSGPLSFDGKTGTGYGVKGGDPRVRGLQAQLTRLGVTDSDGKPLAPDGRYGPKTTSAVKKLQKALGLKADGQVTPELLKQVGNLKQLPPKQTPPPRRRRTAATGQPATRRSRPASAKEALRAVLTGLLQQRRGE